MGVGSYCQRAHQQWSRFEEDVDDVVPLAKSSTIIYVHPVKDYEVKEDEPSYSTGLRSCNWVESISRKVLQSEQRGDVDLNPVISWMESNTEPSQSTLRLSSRATRALWLCRDCLELSDGILFYRWCEKADRELTLVVPASLQEDVLKYCHDVKPSGQMEQKKTIERAKQSFMWYNMQQDCINYVKGCSVCNQNKKPHVRPRASLSLFHAGFPMERVHLDILGPFNPSESGNRYVLMMIDQFSMWVEMCALPEQSAISIATKFVERFIVTFGCPLEVHTDHGRNLDGHLFKALCDLL